MHLFEGIIGHKPITAYLNRVFEANSLAHGYLFAGPEHIGKGTIARQLMAGFFAVSLDSLHHHPDFTVIDREMNEKTGKMYTSIRVEQIRALRDSLRQSALSGKKGVIIRSAHLLSPAAQNALLKTLEEPHGSLLLIFLTENPDQLLPTIHSRIVGLRFHHVNREEICTAIRAKDFSHELAHEIAGLAQGRPGIALSLLEEDSRTLLKQETEEAIAFLERSFAEQSKYATDLAKTISDRRDILRKLQSLESVLHDVLLCASFNTQSIALTTNMNRLTAISNRRDVAGWGKISQSFQECKQAIQENGNIGGAIEHFALTLHL